MFKSTRKRKEFVGQRQQYRRVQEAVNKTFAADLTNRIPYYTGVSTSNRTDCSVSLNNLDTNNMIITDNDISNSEPNLNNVIDNVDLYDDHFIINGSNVCSEHLDDSNTDANDRLYNQNCLTTKLVHWATKRQISHVAVTELLHILSPHHPELPLDCHTLLQTPISTTIVKLETGEFCYFGLNVSLENVLSQQYAKNYLKSAEVLQLSFNIDGIPLFKSNKLQLWPILGRIKNWRCIPFVISLFCGTSKPKPLNLFLTNFINELNELLRNGLNFNDKIFKIEVHSFVCDAPARAFLKCTKTHSGYSSCDKCIEVGEYYKNKVIFPSETAQKRTNESFRQQIDEDHHLGRSPLLDLPIDLIKKFPTDYMHNICLGVVKKLISTWIGGPVGVRLSHSKVQVISQHLVNLQKFIPSEFNSNSK